MIEAFELMKQVAGNVASSYPAYISSDDVASHLSVWMLDNKHTVDTLVSTDEEWEPKLYGTLVRVANTYCLAEEAAINGYSPDDVYHYSTKVVKELLKDAFDYENWQSFSTFGDGQPKSKRVGPTSDRIEMLIDVKRGMEKLTEKQFNILSLRYNWGFDDEIIGDAMGIKPVSVPKAIDRAIESLRKKMGKESLADMRNAWDSREKVYATEGERVSISNSTAQRLADSYYEG